jgi:hypothetical protein
MRSLYRLNEEDHFMAASPDLAGHYMTPRLPRLTPPVPILRRNTSPDVGCIRKWERHFLRATKVPR